MQMAGRWDTLVAYPPSSQRTSQKSSTLENPREKKPCKQQTESCANLQLVAQAAAETWGGGGGLSVHDCVTYDSMILLL